MLSAFTNKQIPTWNAIKQNYKAMRWKLRVKRFRNEELAFTTIVYHYV